MTFLFIAAAQRKPKAAGDSAPATPISPYSAPFNPAYPSYPPPYGQPGANMYGQQQGAGKLNCDSRKRSSLVSFL